MSAPQLHRSHRDTEGGPDHEGANNVTDFTAGYLPTCRTGGGELVYDLFFVARARNPEGVTATTSG